MSILSLHTNLKSLKYGSDRLGGGSSNQPYITTPIPEGDTFLDIPNEDFILRGGLLAFKNTTEDVLRLGKYYTDVKNPSGLFFTLKQNLLSRLAVRTQSSGQRILNEGIYTPLSTLAQTSVEAFGIHLNKQGLNPFPDAIGSLRTYTDAINPKLGLDEGITDIKNNRLVLLGNTKIYLQSPDSPLRNKLAGITDETDFINILKYQGGPGAPLGIGNTNIRFADQRTNISSNNGGTLVLNLDQIFSNSEINNEGRISSANGVSFSPKTIDFRKSLRANLNNESTIISDSPSYLLEDNKTIENRVKLGDPGNLVGKNVFSYTSGYNGSGASSFNSYDRVNAKPLYNSSNVSKEDTNDLVKFRIAIINNDNPSDKKEYIHFRAFLNTISDSYNSEWQSIKYIGRGENFYSYSGFDRKLSLSWTVAAQSKIELIPMYQKLNFLASTLAPDYSKAGFMRGNLVELTIGGYLFNQPGFITSLNYELSEDSTWEIGINEIAGNDDSVKEVPHIIRVTGFNFVPIHNFVPRKQQNLYNNANGEISTFGDERFVALNNGLNNNYQPRQIF